MKNDITQGGEDTRTIKQQEEVKNMEKSKGKTLRTKLYQPKEYIIHVQIRYNLPSYLYIHKYIKIYILFYMLKQDEKMTH